MVTRFLCLMGMLLALCAGPAGAAADEASAQSGQLRSMAVVWQPGNFDVRVRGYGGLVQPKLSFEDREKAREKLAGLLLMFGRRIPTDMITALSRINITSQPFQEARWRLVLQPAEGYYDAGTLLSGISRKLTIRASLYDVKQAKEIWTDTQDFWGVTSTQEGEATVLEFAEKMVDVMRRYLP